jgi:hypothetical protein
MSSTKRTTTTTPPPLILASSVSWCQREIFCGCFFGVYVVCLFPFLSATEGRPTVSSSCPVL